MTTTQDGPLARDHLGPPYELAYPGIRSLADALAVARSKHPSRVLANTNGYRYGAFEEYPNPAHPRDSLVKVTMMRSTIARYTAEGVRLYACGYSGQTTSEALNMLAPGFRQFYTKNFVLMLAGTPYTDGTLFPYDGEN